MDLMLLLLAVAAFPVACLGFVLWMGVIEDSIPAGVARAARQPDPPPILMVPVRRTATAEAPGWWESVAGEAETPRPTPANLTPDIPEQRAPAPARPAIPAPEPLAGT